MRRWAGLSLPFIVVLLSLTVPVGSSSALAWCQRERAVAETERALGVPERQGSKGGHALRQAFERHRGGGIAA